MKNLTIFSLLIILSIPSAFAQAGLSLGAYSGICMPGIPMPYDVLGFFYTAELETECNEKNEKIEDKCKCLKDNNNTVAASVKERAAFESMKNQVNENRTLVLDQLYETFARTSYYENFQRMRLGVDKKNENHCDPKALEQVILETVQGPMVKEAMAKGKITESPDKGLEKFFEEKKVRKGFVGELFTKDGIANSLESYSRLNASKMADETKAVGSCFTLKEYYGIKSLPSNEALEEISRWKLDSAIIEDNSKLFGSSELSKFVSSNPILLKIISSPGDSQDSLSKIQDFAKANKNKDPVIVQENFTNFLKNEMIPALDKLNNKQPSSDMLMCADIGRKMVAAQIFNHYGDQKSSSTNLLNLCTSRTLSGEQNLDATLKSNAVYRLVDEQRNVEETNNETFETFSKKNCQGFDEFKAIRKKIACSQTNCSLLKAEDMALLDEEIRQAFIVSQHTQNKNFDLVLGMKKLGIGGGFKKKESHDFASSAGSSSVTKKMKQAYNDLMNKMGNLPLVAKTGQEENFTKTQNETLKSAARGNESGQVNTYQQTAYEQQVPSTQFTESLVQPSWINDNATISLPKISIDNIAQGNQALLPKNFESLTAREKVKALDAAEKNIDNFVSENSNEVKALENQIKDMREELVQARKVASKEIENEPSSEVKKQVAKSPETLSPSMRPTQLANSQAFVGQFATGGGSASFGSSPANFVNSPSVSNSASSSRDAALLSSKYANDQKEKSRNLASVDGLTIQVSSDAIANLPSGLGTPRTLTVTDGQLNEIKGSSEALNKVLQSRFKELGLSQGESKLVELKSSDSDKKMYLHAVWKDNNWVFHPFNRSVQEQISRTYTLKSLSETLQ